MGRLYFKLFSLLLQVHNWNSRRRKVCFMLSAAACFVPSIANDGVLWERPSLHGKIQTDLHHRNTRKKQPHLAEDCDSTWSSLYRLKDLKCRCRAERAEVWGLISALFREKRPVQLEQPEMSETPKKRSALMVARESTLMQAGLPCTQVLGNTCHMSTMWEVVFTVWAYCAEEASCPVVRFKQLARCKEIKI